VSTPETTKISIWDYVQTLFVLGEMYVNKDTTMISEINKIYHSMSISEMKRFENSQVTEFSSDFRKKIK